jgi:hypothetical protein
MISSLTLSVCMVVLALSIGIIGYHWIAGFGWIDALLEASMILGGMGPINPLASDEAKLFASAYALFSGLVFIGIMGILLAPMLHRLMHAFHVDEQTRQRSSKSKND